MRQEDNQPPLYPLEVYEEILSGHDDSVKLLSPEDYKIAYLLGSSIYYNSREEKYPRYVQQNVMFVNSYDTPKIEKYIKEHNGSWITKRSFKLPNSDVYRVAKANNNSRGHKPYKVIIDNDIDIDILKTIVIPSCIHCCHFEVF